MGKLPLNWAASTLGEICSKPQYGWTCQASKRGTLRIIRTTDISKKQISWDTVPFCANAPENIDKYRIKKNDILVSRAGSVGVSYRVDKVPYDAVFASYLIRFKPKSTINPKYIEYYLMSDDYWKSIFEFSAGIAVPNVNASKLSDLQIPVAPITEQHRIVAKLEKLLAKVDKCKKRLEKIPAILKRFRQSVLAAACSGKLTEDWRGRHPGVESAEDLLLKIVKERKSQYHKECENRNKKSIEILTMSKGPSLESPNETNLPSSWKYILSYDLFSFVTSGSRGWAKYYSKEGAKFIRIGNLSHSTIDIDLENIQRIHPPHGSEGNRTRIKENDILISITADTGMIGFVQFDIGEAYVNQHIALSRPVKGYSAKYLAWFLASEDGQNQFNALQRGVTKAGLGLDDIKGIRVPSPPMEEQHEIVRRVEALFKTADQVEARHLKAKVQVDKLTQSILAKAFRGELVPQDPNDEPASELLKRIKAEKAKTITERKI